MAEERVFLAVFPASFGRKASAPRSHKSSVSQDEKSDIKLFLKKQASLILGLEERTEAQNASASIGEARRRTQKAIKRLQGMGLGVNQAQRLFAEVMSEILTTYVNKTYAGQWNSPSTIAEQLREWVENHFSRLVVEILSCLKENQSDAEADEHTKVTHADVERWQEMGLNKLGALRTKELFDIIVDWDNGSRGAVEDLKRYVTNTTSRIYLTNSFSNVLSHRLLQPGASTTEILQFYISLIRAFAVLDPKGVLLDRVARPIRRYLRERDDTVNIVVGGLLADPEDESSATDVLVELTTELNKSAGLTGEDDMDDGDLDWDDMSWMPDPVDAGPEYKKSKNSDIIGSLISLFESRDVLVKEFQKILGERLLKREYDFDKETRVLELLKLRFGEAALQSCEVMLRDISDSRRVDMVIRNDQKLAADATSDLAPEIHTKILSHLFWPSLHSETFFIPLEILSLQDRYSKGFEILKQARKLTWLHALGQVTVDIDLDDRTVTEEVQTWQASVIYAFQSPESSAPTPVVKTVQELMQNLEMDEPLVRNALTFWVGKLVLEESASDTYRVLETLSDSEAGRDGTAQAAIAAAAEAVTSAAAPAVRTEEVAQERMEVYWQYVTGMLTNQGPMPLQSIVMMLKMLVEGGFPFKNEELKEFLERRVQEGKLEVVGGNYKIKH